jgi:hypothetical protein
MTHKDKARLLELLTQTHETTHAALEGVDLEMHAYSDSSWRIRNILGHIATWDRQVAKSLRAFRVGGEYAIPDLNETAFNEQEVLGQQDLTTQQLLEEWERAREDFVETVMDIPVDQFPGDLLYPWGEERGTIAQLVETMTEHDVEHRDEILKAIRLSLGA